MKTLITKVKTKINEYDRRTQVIAGSVMVAVVLLLITGVAVIANQDSTAIALDSTSTESASSEDNGVFNVIDTDSDSNETNTANAASATTSDEVTTVDASSANASNDSDSKDNGRDNKDDDITWVPHYATRVIEEAWDEPVYQNKPVYENKPIYEKVPVYEVHKIDNSDGTDLTIAYEEYKANGPYEWTDSASNPYSWADWCQMYGHTDFHTEQVIVGYETVQTGTEKVQTGTEKVQVDTIHHEAVTEEYIDYYYNEDDPSETKPA